MKLLFAAAGIAALAFSQAHAQTLPSVQTPGACRGTELAGIVQDATLALIPGAILTLDGGQSETSGSDGKFRFTCVAAGPHHLSADAQGFAKREISLAVPHAGSVSFVLQPNEVETQVDVDNDAIGTSTTTSGPNQTISGKRLQTLADDPDDLLRELQQLASAGGGSAANTTIAVDGFQDSSTLPPKSSIAYIKVNPDQFSAEYREPPFDGGRVEVYTKPGQKAFHGALFATNGSPWMNARDPFSTSKAAIGKQRYGFELTGPIRKQGSDFALTLEHRSIDDFAVVNAFIPDSSGNPVPFTSNVPTPQRLWIGNARMDWQLGPKNTFIANYSANVNHLQNVNVGGTALQETGYDDARYEHMLRFSDITTVSAHLMHEARLSLRWDGHTATPASIAPQVQVAGAFTKGGSNQGAQQLREFNIEFDDDAILTTKSHTLKFGTQFMMYDDHQQLPTNFNGTYIYSSLAQYNSGTPEAYSSVTGTPGVNFTQFRNALFVQDDWNVGHGVHIAGGVRYFVQNYPTVLNSATPRAGILWSPTKKGTWTLHAHAGMFSGRYGTRDAAEMLREDGVARVTSIIYNPVSNSTPIYSRRVYAPHITNLTWQAENIGGTRSFPHGWNLSADYYIGRFWNYARTLNINSPLNDDPLGPRPGAPDYNVLQLQNSGQGSVNAEFFGIEQHTLKYVQFFMGGVRVNLIDDTNDDSFFSPQSSTSNEGEFAHRSGQNGWNLFGNASVKLPGKIDFSMNFNGGGEGHYNITTGADNNGDGNFNDRPEYAAPGQPGAISTPFGMLVPSGGIGVFPRNKGVMPWAFFLDTNIQRSFMLSHDAKAEHKQTLTVNLRSANILNHTNVTQVGGVLGSPLFGVPYAASNGRRIEAGLRYSF